MLVDSTLAAFSKDLAARTPTPGGGSAAACIGSLGAALGLMAARFTTGKPAFQSHEAALAREIESLEALRVRLLALVDEDAAAFAGFGAAQSLPRATPEEKAARKAAVQGALTAALDVPLRIGRTAVDGLSCLGTLVEHCTPHLASDVAVGAYALGAAWRAAWVNVLVNLAALDDGDLVARVRAEGEVLGRRARSLEDRIGATVVAALAPATSHP